MLTLGLIVSMAAVPASVAVVAFVIVWLGTGPADPDPFSGVPVGDIVVVWAISTPIAIGAILSGLRLVRRNRRLVLFLRRFGHGEARRAITFAVVGTIGESWRVVTLDDAAMAPVGVAPATRSLFHAGRVAAKSVLAVMQFLGPRMFPILVSAMWAVLVLALVPPALDLARTGSTTSERWTDALDPFFRILASLFEWQPPIAHVAATLPGAFALLAMAAAISFGVMLASMAALLLALPLSTALSFLSSSADAVREADTVAHPTVNTPVEVKLAASRIARLTTRVFGPRIVVLRVATAVWQEAVRELAAVATLPLIDISEPTDNVVWEIVELLQRFGHDCIFIGQHERVRQLATAPARAPAPADAKLRELLAGREVLAYTTDDPGLRRFARALRGTLITRQID